MIFHFRLFPGKSDNKIFQKIQKHHFWPILRQRRFSSKFCIYTTLQVNSGDSKKLTLRRELLPLSEIFVLVLKWIYTDERV